MIKIKVFLLFYLFVNVSSVSAQFLWAQQLGGVNNDEGRAVVTDAGGNVYTAGYFEVQMDADPGTGAFLLDSSDGGAFLIKLNPAGNLIWAKNFGSSNARAVSMSLDPAGNLLVCGGYSGTGDFDPGSVTSYTMSSSGTESAFVLKLSSSGSFLWARTLATLSVCTLFGVATDPLNNVLIGGRYSGIIDLDPGPTSLTVSSAGAYDAFLCKLDGTGNFLWGRSLGDTAYDGISAITCDGNGNILCAGLFTGLVDFDPGPAAVTLSTSVYNVFVLKLTNSGTFAWVKKLESSSPFERINAIKTDASGNIYSAGYFMDSTDFDPGPLVYMPIHNITVLQSFVWKLGSTGNFYWAKVFNGNNSVFSQGLVLDNFNNCYVCGVTSAGVDFDPGPATYTLSASYYDNFVCKLDSSGNFNWAKSTGGTDLDEAFGIALDPSGNIFAVGSFSLIADFDPGALTYNLTAYGSKDAFVQKLAPCNAPPVPLNTSLPSQINACYLTLDSLTVSGNGTINWYVGPYNNYIVHTGPTYTFLAVPNNTYYTTYYVEAVTCTPSHTRLIVTYTLNPLPNVNITATSLLCLGDSTLLQATGADNYSWNTGATTSSIIVHPSIPTTYKVIGKTVVGCSDTSSITIYVQDCTGLLSTEVADKFKYYPNPSLGKFIMEVDNEMEISISNCLGEIVLHRLLMPGKNEFLWNNNDAKGVYFIQTSDRGQRLKRYKLILE